MKTNILILAIVLIATVARSQNVKYVKGHYKSNGTYTQGYYRTGANHTVNDNFSTSPNVNPYNGKTGTKQYYINASSYKNYSRGRKK